MRAFFALLFLLVVVPCVCGQQKATVNCINAKTVPLFDSTGEQKIAGWVRCGTEVSVIGLLPNGEFYLVEAETATGQTMRGNVAKFWLTLAFLPSTTPTTVSQSTSPAASLPPTNSQPPHASPSVFAAKLPSIIGLTYPVKNVALGKTIRIHLHEEDEKLTMDVTYPDGEHTSQSVEYAKVNFVKQTKEENGVDIDAYGDSMSVSVRTEDEAEELAKYVAQKSPFHLELIGDAWRIRKPFQCPESAQIGCRDFKELLDHDDPDIVDAFYWREGDTTRSYACFSDSGRRFFTVSYGLPRRYVKSGMFIQNIFIDGQSNTTNLHRIEWSQPGSDYGTIFSSSTKPGTKQSVRSPHGYISQADLDYQTKFENKTGTQTNYSLNIRWSTGRFKESFSFKDDKGKLLNVDETGICVKLN